MELYLTWDPPTHTHTYTHYAMEYNVTIMKNAIKLTGMTLYKNIVLYRNFDLE